MALLIYRIAHSFNLKVAIILPRNFQHHHPSAGLFLPAYPFANLVLVMEYGQIKLSQSTFSSRIVTFPFSGFSHAITGLVSFS